MSADIHETICAIATPMGEGGVGILRVSGEKSVEVASLLVRLRSGKSLHAISSHRLYHADLLNPAFHLNSTAGQAHGSRRALGHGGIIDEALVVVMRAPHSYTGETVVEIHCHGGPLVLQLLCESLIRSGARLAEPGEFTKRAFLNGRLDLTQAEAVLDTIRAKTEGALRVAQDQLRGSLSAEIDGLRENLIRLLAHVEAAIDFTEEDISFIQPEELARCLQATISDLDQLAESCREGRILREGVTAAIVGRPNVGKSSLLNALLRTDRAIVTAVPGTTRDVLEEVLNIRGVPVRLLDTAGIRHSEDLIEQEGVRRSWCSMERAELLLVLVDGSVPLRDEDRELIGAQGHKKKIVIVNKCDLPEKLDRSKLSALHGKEPAPLVVGISAKTGAGLDALRDCIRSMVLGPDFEPGEGAMVTRLRHLSALNRAKDALGNSARSVAESLSGEFVAMDLRAAIEALGEITGAVSTDDILDRIFREFCIGK